MLEQFEDILRRKIQFPDNEGRNKVCSLREAIQKNVKPGMTLCFAFTSSRYSSAALYELARQFWDTSPDFTLVCSAVGGPMMILFHGGLVKKVITTYCGDPYYTPAPNPVYQAAYREKRVAFENWSLLTFALRLKAAAMGLKFMPTNSLIGSSMAEENKESFSVIDDPFGSGEPLGVVKALHPDLTLIHALVSDQFGNTILTPPYMENVYGAMASQKGTLVTVEKIVPTSFVRSYPHLVKLPGEYVTSVCEIPFGAHPGGIHNHCLKELESYSEDYDFVAQIHQVSGNKTELDRWIKEWVLDCKDHRDYLEKLGYKRILSLKGKSHSDSWRYELESLASDLSTTEAYTPVEMALVVAARKLKEIVLRRNCRTILSGAGLPNLAAWLAYYNLREEGYDIELMAEIGLYGYSPRPADPSIFNQRNYPTCKMLTDLPIILGVLAGSEKSKCLASLGAAQIDKYGNINTTRVADLYIGGSGGGNDAVTTAQEVVVTCMQRPTNFVDKVSYITSPGKKVRTLVSTLGVLEKIGDDEEFTLVGYFPNPRLSTVEEKVRYIKENCGWELKVSPQIQEVEPPTLDELKLLRLFDPRRFFLGKQP